MAKKLAKKKPETLCYEELEQRVLFSADVVPGLDNDATQEPALVVDITHELEDNRTVDDQSAEQAEKETRRELVFINDNVPDIEKLMADLQNADDNRVVEFVTLSSQSDGIGQVSDILGQRTNLDAVHFITHGADARINLGGTWLDASTLQQNLDAVAGWGNALTADGDILFYGCNIAAADNGQILLNDIAGLTGAEVAASEDVTGSAALDGDWDLEYSHGRIEAETLIDQQNSELSWQGLLATPVATDDAFTVFAGEPVTVDPLANDTDADSDPLSITEIIDTANGDATTTLTNPGDTATLASGTQIELRADGRLKITAAAAGAESFDYTVDDGNGGTDTGTISLTVGDDEATALATGFVTTWQTDNPGTSADDTITIPIGAGDTDFTVFWGDGTSTDYTGGSATHTYASAGTQTVAIVGGFPGVNFTSGGDGDKLLSIEH
ncbi:MAG: DUF4347 domain-containing protein, partial [Sulfitobacter sp.]|nr:DUF4347 domain-containing protein [Sulfitobacter sp.]